MRTAHVTAKTIANDVETLADDSAKLARQALGQILDPASQAAHQAVEKVREAADKTGERTRVEITRCVNCIRDHPLSAIAIAALGGAILGTALLCRRH